MTFDPHTDPLAGLTDRPGDPVNGDLRPLGAPTIPVRSQTVPKPRKARRSRWDNYGLCEVWTGHPADYQDEARRALYHGSGTALPWIWVYSTCGEPLCLEDRHIQANSPQVIEYPKGVCVYCGAPALTMDHLVPEVFAGKALSAFVATVPACLSCNSTLGDRGSYRITERRDLVHEYIRKSRSNGLSTHDFTEDELIEFGPSLRSHIREGMAKKRYTLLRLDWPEDPNYDLRAFQKSGIEDPYGLGLI